MDSKRNNGIMRALTIIVIGLITIIGAIVIWPTYQRGLELEKEEAELDRRIEAKKAEIAKFRDFQRRFNEDRDFVETIARQNRRVYPGELVFTFED